MKRIEVLIFSLLLIFTFTACSHSIADSEINTSKNQTEPPAEIPTEAPTATPDINVGSSIQAEVPVESPEDSSTQKADSGDEIIDITEKMYVLYINEIYINAEDYIGKTIRVEGMYTSEYYEPTDTTYYYVYRVGPGCCGNDGSMCGFEFSWDGADTLTENDWIEVVGVLDSYEEEGKSFLTLRAQTVTVMDERGAETVYQ
jgi:putative membrane protein